MSLSMECTNFVGLISSEHLINTTCFAPLFKEQNLLSLSSLPSSLATSLSDSLDELSKGLFSGPYNSSAYCQN